MEGENGNEWRSLCRMSVEDALVQLGVARDPATKRSSGGEPLPQAGASELSVLKSGMQMSEQISNSITFHHTHLSEAAVFFCAVAVLWRVSGSHP